MEKTRLGIQPGHHLIFAKVAMGSNDHSESGFCVTSHPKDHAHNCTVYLSL